MVKFFISFFFINLVYRCLFFIGKYVGNRPIKLRKSTWQERNIDIVRKKTKDKIKMGLR
jgi:hypothetical protein